MATKAVKRAKAARKTKENGLVTLAWIAGGGSVYLLAPEMRQQYGRGEE
jgi:hypothetical protein